MTTELYRELAQFDGTESYHILSLNRNVVATDGVEYLVQTAQCFWLFDLIASYLPSVQACVKKYGEDFTRWHLWTLTKKGQGAIAEARTDIGEPVLISQKLEYTDFPFDETGVLKLFVAPQQIGERIVLVVMLPNEY